MSNPLDPNFKSLAREHKGKVARTHKDNTSECRLSRQQFDRLPAHEKVNAYFASNISRRAQAEFHNNPKLSLYNFSLTLNPR